MGGDDEDADDEEGTVTHQITYDSDMDGDDASNEDLGDSRKNRRSNNTDLSFNNRPTVPVMGVSASTLSQSSCKVFY